MITDFYFTALRTPLRTSLQSAQRVLHYAQTPQFDKRTFHVVPQIVASHPYLCHVGSHLWFPLLGIGDLVKRRAVSKIFRPWLVRRLHFFDSRFFKRNELLLCNVKIMIGLGFKRRAYQ